jgi:hypothetical protein
MMMRWKPSSRGPTGWLHRLSLPLAVVLLIVAAVPPAQAAPTPQGSPPGGATFTPGPGKLSPLPILKFDTSQSTNFDQALPKMSQMEPLVHDLQGKLDASQFDLDALGASLEYDPAKIIAFVRTQIAFEQYPGVLRGEFGTLIGRAGNAFDKALLLRRLLDDAGYETRLVRTTLSDTQARSLVSQMAQPRPAAPPIADPAALTDIRGRLQEIAGSPPAGAASTLAFDKFAVARDLSASDSALILDGLKRAGITLGQAGGMNDLVREARDYLWVQYRLGSYDKWLDIHPAFVDAAAAPTGLKIETFYRNTLPDDLYHRVRLQVTVEQKLGDKLIATPVVSNWERKSADLAGHPITFETQPDNFNLETFTDLPTLIKGAAVFVPVLDGKMADRAFDLHGGTYNASLLSLGAIGLAQSGQASNVVAGQVAGALGGGSGETDPNYVTLTAEWIDYTLVAPGGQETHFRRYVLDRVGDANRVQGKAEIIDRTPLLEAAKALLTTYTMMVLPGEYTPAYVSHRAVERLAAELKLRSSLRPGMKLPEFPVDALRTLIPLEDTVLNAAFANAVAPGSGLVAYRAAPALAIYEQGVTPGKLQTAYERVDVIRNARRVFSVRNGAVTPAPEDAVRIGAWETFAERAPLRQGGVPFGALTAIRQATDAGIALRILKPGDGAVLAGLGHSDATKASVQRDLEAGYIVILPDRTSGTATGTGWWRVDPATGETLGIATGGYGDSMVEYAITLFYAAGFFAIGTASCYQQTGDGFCCVMSNLVMGAMGFGAGMFIGSIAAVGIADAGIAWLVSFLLGDVGLGIGGFVFPSLCSAKVPELVK